jgi:hypothetical protein
MGRHAEREKLFCGGDTARACAFRIASALLAVIG